MDGTIAWLAGLEPFMGIKSKAESKEPVEAFMKGYLRSQSRFLKRESSNSVLHSQHVLEIKQKKLSAIVITSGIVEKQRRRYTVLKEDGDWRIATIELQCLGCYGLAEKYTGFLCDRCWGQGWTSM